MAGLPLFPSLVGLAFPVTRKGWMFDTIKQTAISGKTTTFPKRITPLHNWELSFDILRSDPQRAELQILAGFYASRFGCAYAFGYVDPVDGVVTNQLLGAGDGARTQFQLVRAFGGFVEPIYLPVALPTIMVDGGVMVLGTDYTLAVGGIVTFVKPVKAGLQVTWSGTYAWMCRFDQEGIEFQNFAKDLWSAEKVSFTSIIF